MDIDKFLHRNYFSDYGKITTLRELKNDFFREKVDAIFQKIRLAPICPCKQENLPQKMIEIFPTTVVYREQGVFDKNREISTHLEDLTIESMKGVFDKNREISTHARAKRSIFDKIFYKDWEILHLPNVDVKREWDELSFFDAFRIRYVVIHDPVGFLEEINEQVPAWNEEFELLCRQYADSIQQRERKRQQWCAKDTSIDLDWFEKRYLQDKIADTLLMVRSHPEAVNHVIENMKSILPQDTDIKSLLKSKDVSMDIKMEHLHLSIVENERRSWVKGNFQNYEFDFSEKLLTLEQLQLIDTQLPVWLQEAQELHYAVKKEEKAKQVGRNLISVLVKNQMREKDKEFQLTTTDGRNGNLLLTVKLQKKRMLKVTLPADNLERAKQLLAALSTHMAAIDSVPMNFRISFQDNNMQWEK